MKNHKYLSIITASPVRSRNYKPSCLTLIPEACICLYVPVKGYIPIDEVPFRTSYNNIRTDVREGIFTPYMHSQDTEDCLRFGCQIENSPLCDTPQSGALCGFIEHPRYGTCGITSAHVLLNHEKFEKLKREGEIVSPLFPENRSLGYVYWRCSEKQIRTGEIVRALYCTGDEEETGYEVTLFKVTSGRPKTGQFYGDECETYNTGFTYDYLWMADSPFVFKYGWKTKKTEAKFDDDNICVSVKTANVVLGETLSFELHGQLSVTSKTFADKGDSGAPVLTRRHDGEIVCVGMVTGGTSFGDTVVTPIRPILKALKVSGLKNFETSNHADRLDQIVGSLQKMDTKLEQLLKLSKSQKEEKKEGQDSDTQPGLNSYEEININSDTKSEILKRKANSPNLNRKKKKE
ncbi:uncharacterized protein LOC128553939 [Mercenaria mercenaria]|uniref:uncharacterized protein LOC128553939 n=1 Tax=Mercenaria mercenaria TaxID=6596 RepID=UPI00234E8CEF|nr:uncharacterized protein LOC128553939 [Mercenaria mercenaria]